MKPSRESQRVHATHAPSPALRWLLVLPLVAFVASVAPSQAADPIASSPDANSNLTATLLNPPSPATSNVLFRRLAPNETGITSSHVFPRSASSELLQDQGAGAGVCIADFDADGLPDLFVTHYDRGNRLYRNRGGWRFEDVSRIAGIEAVGRWCSGASAADVDGDGDLDIAVAVFGAPGLIFVNQGGGRFVERASELGLGFSGAGVAFAFADYDRDGRLDAYLVTHRLSVGSDHRLPRSGQESLERSVIRIGPDRRAVLNPRYDELFGLAEKAPGRAELFVAGQRDRLFRNTAGSGFRDVSEAAGIRGTDVGLAGIWWDYDQDGFPDLYVSNDYKGPDRLFRNLGDGTFRDVAAEVLPLMPLASMGSDVADIDNDGHLDLLATEMAGSNRMRRARILEDPRDRWFLRSSRPRQVGRNALYLGTGTEQVLEAAFLAGIARTDWTWSPKFGDFDNDGWTDLFVANGMSRDYVDADLLRAHRERGGRGWREAPVLREANLAYRHLGGLAFREVGKAWGLDTVTASFGAACGDLDRDGDLDLVVMNFDEPLSVFRNESTANHRLLVRLRGATGNTFGVGARVVVRTASLALTRTVGVGSGFLSANEPVLHFGLGEATEVSELAVHWPNGGRSTFARLSADRLYEIREPATSASTTNALPPPAASTPPR
ncbi:MAG: CRTAC1 family protein, partial [Verrucomicrobiales bacterium]|nr:CRTAC1 family protein [Verrucomicrobiales bacterium]